MARRYTRTVGFPAGGIDRSLPNGGYADGKYAYDALNVIPRDLIEKRVRGGVRSGFGLALYDPAPATFSLPIRLLNKLVVVKDTTQKEFYDSFYGQPGTVIGWAASPVQPEPLCGNGRCYALTDERTARRAFPSDATLTVPYEIGIFVEPDWNTTTYNYSGDYEIIVGQSVTPTTECALSYAMLSLTFDTVDKTVTCTVRLKNITDPARANLTAYVPGNYVYYYDSVAKIVGYFECTQGGTTAASPAFIYPDSYVTAPSGAVTDDGTVKWTCREAETVYTSTAVPYTYIRPGWFKARVDPAADRLYANWCGDNFVFWIGGISRSDIPTDTIFPSDIPTTRCGINLDNTGKTLATVISAFRIQYQTSGLEHQRERLIVGHNGSLYWDSTIGLLEAISTGSATIRTDAFCDSVERYQKLYICDGGLIKKSTGEIVSGNYLFDSSVARFDQIGLSADNQLVKIYDGATGITDSIHYIFYAASGAIPWATWVGTKAVGDYCTKTISGVVHIFRVSTAGTCGGTEPTWNHLPGQTTNEVGVGTAVWTCESDWVSGEAYTVGLITRPSTHNNRRYVCSVAGSIGTEPSSFPTSVGANLRITSTPQYSTKRLSWAANTRYGPGSIITRTSVAAWQPATAYILNDLVIRNALGECGLLFRCTAPGTSLGAEPAWTLTPGANTVEGGGPTWTAERRFFYAIGTTGSPASGVSGATEPAWNTTLGGTTNDGSCVWTTLESSWVNATATPLDRVVYPLTSWNGRRYRCVATTGNTGAVEPVWPTAVGATIVDGNVTWQCEQASWEASTYFYNYGSSDRRSYIFRDTDGTRTNPWGNFYFYIEKEGKSGAAHPVGWTTGWSVTVDEKFNDDLTAEFTCEIDTAVTHLRLASSTLGSNSGSCSYRIERAAKVLNGLREGSSVSAWAANKNYAIGDEVQNPTYSQFSHVSTVAGKSCALAPSFPWALNATVQEKGGPEWECKQITWKASTAYSLNAIVVSSRVVIGAVSQVRQYRCVIAGTSNTTEPNPWDTTIGNTIVDGTVTWKCEARTWVASTNTALGDIIYPTQYNGYHYICTTAGVTNAGEPTWGTTPGGTTADNTATWTCYRDKWVANTAYTTSDYIYPTTWTGYYYQCSTAGTTTDTEPTWSTTVGNKSYEKTGPTWYTVLRATLSPLVPYAGLIPLGCSIIARYRDRIVLAGDPESPSTFYMSRAGNPFDWNYGASTTDSTRAFAGQPAGAGEVADPITALIPHRDDLLIFGCTNSLWVLRGDPGWGGQLENVSKVVGVVGPRAWCKGPQGEVIFMAKDGLRSMSPGGAPEPLTQASLPTELKNLNPVEYDIVLGYDQSMHGVHVFVSPLGFATNERTYYFFFCYITRSWWRIQVPHAPTCCVHWQADHPMDAGMIFGCEDGKIRRFRDQYFNDDGTAITSTMYLGPFAVSSPENNGYLHKILATLDINSHDATYNIIRSNEARPAYAASDVYQVGTWSKGLNTTTILRMRAPWMMVTISGAENKRWAFERLVFEHSQAGRMRKL